FALVSAGAYQHEAAPQFFTLEAKFQFATRQLFLCTESALRRVRAFVPDDDFAASVLALGNGTFKRSVVEGVIFDLNRQPLVGGVHGRSLRHGPGLQHPVEFQTQVVVQASGCVLLHHKLAIASPLGGAARFSRLLKVALASVFGEVGHSKQYRQPLPVLAPVTCGARENRCLCSVAGTCSERGSCLPMASIKREGNRGVS